MILDMKSKLAKIVAKMKKKSKMKKNTIKKMVGLFGNISFIVDYNYSTQKKNVNIFN